MKVVSVWCLAALTPFYGLAASPYAEEGLVLYYSFDEGAGSTVRDRSGNGNDGRIQGAEYIRSGDGFALRFDGVDDCVDCPPSPSLDLTNAVTVEAWVYPEAVPAVGEAGIVGKGYDSYVLTYYRDGRCWWYISGGGNHCQALLTTGSWHHVAGTFDGQSLRLYVDGKLVAERRSRSPRINRGPNLFLATSAGDPRFTRHAHFKGMLDEVRIYNRALSAKEVQMHYRTTNLTRQVELTVQPLPFRSEVKVGLGLRGLGVLPEGTVAEVTLRKAGREEALQRRQVLLPAGALKVEVALPAKGLAPGRYEIHARVRDRTGAVMGTVAVKEVTWSGPPSWPNAGPEVKVLNNLVTELLNVRPTASRAPKGYTFLNPREGWIFIASTAEVEHSGRVQVVLDSEGLRRPLIVHTERTARTQEAMRFLPAGEHRLDVSSEGQARLRHLVVRAIPELIYCRFPTTPHVREFGPYDRDFLERDVLCNVNTIVGSRQPQVTPFVRQWKEQGKKWLVECGVPGLRREQTVTADEAFAYWSSNVAFREPAFDGLIADEFGGAPAEKYRAWTEAVQRLHDQPEFRGKTFYPYCGALFGDPASRAFIETVVRCGYRFAWEQYFREPPTEQAARDFLNTWFKGRMLGWRKAIPGCERHLIICFGYLSAPPESLNTNPSVDYKVWMDMQFNLVANDPAFWGLYGIMEYLSTYADEEVVRWAGRLYRHYCIEGHTEMLSQDPYELTHLENPDFAEGLAGWTVSPAQEGSIAVKHLEGYGWLQGRYPRTSEGDTFLWLKRNGERPNVISQQIKNLQPGRLYSLKMYTADYQDLREGKSVKQRHALSIVIDKGELVREKCFQHVFANCYSHHWGPFDAQHRAWMNYHWRVFRAKGRTAQLTISDWASATEPGGPIGQELMFNFIEIQPYLE